MTSICVVGLGYIGLPTAAVLARTGAEVIGVDVSDRHVDAVNRGELPFVEAGLGEAVADAVSRGRLRAQKDTPDADVYIVAVPTPFRQGPTGDHEADLSYVDDAARGIAPQLVGDELVVLESTSPPGTTERVAEVIMGERPDLSLDGSGGRPVVHFAHCPERVLPGRIMTEMVTNSRIIGGLTPRAAELARDLYATFCEGELRLTDARTAEMAKLTENSFRDVNIAFANELSIICEKLGIDVWELIELANLHPRVNILQPGPGVGGHCIAVDPWFIVSAAPDEARLIHMARQVNDSKPLHVIQRVREAVAGMSSPKIATLGLAFKPDVDDLRESPALSITRDLASQLPAAKVLAAEPNITEPPASLTAAPNIAFVDYRAAIAAADVVVLLVDHREFKELDRSLLEGKRMIDIRGAWR
ncbi:UDP-N-acetyl-D-mannosaminuronic acid dehydrogenase [Actinomyces ruminicola]|uniref:UDP-N-acetyl-D-mannosaminuronic acid dehydrogenase n=1 Tax=Actinomyces ruminicola TaxID=332524 RepID=A0A1G9ZMX8_9ACTO|nr:UDP-N-acetyl-D-mannosamine dehydrogenase [Actinomyces ruminicola]SDN22341.1 UDP-N-acetyl-D-mannosaminuronic acid dehydrogenase [Actinomyces ruminicola]